LIWPVSLCSTCSSSRRMMFSRELLLSGLFPPGTRAVLLLDCRAPRCSIGVIERPPPAEENGEGRLPGGVNGESALFASAPAKGDGGEAPNPGKRGLTDLEDTESFCMLKAGLFAAMVACRAFSCSVKLAAGDVPVPPNLLVPVALLRMPPAEAGRPSDSI